MPFTGFTDAVYPFDNHSPSELPDMFGLKTLAAVIEITRTFGNAFSCHWRLLETKKDQLEGWSGELVRS